MNIKQYMIMRLVIPIGLVIWGTFASDPKLFYCVAAGYMFAWLFSFIAICKEFANTRKQE